MKLNPTKIILLIVATFLLWFFRPLFQPAIIFFIAHPLIFILLASLVLLFWNLIVSFLKVSTLKVVRENNRFKVVEFKVGPKRIFLTSIGILLVFFTLSLENDLRNLYIAKQLSYEKRQDVPTFSPLRLTPKGVARRYAEDSFQNPQEYLGDSQIVLVDGKLQRVFPRLPDGTLLEFVNKLNGFVTVEVDTLDRKVNIYDQKFKYAEGTQFFDNLYFQLSLKKFFVKYSREPIYLKNDEGRWVTVVPYIKYRGFPVTTPYWGGVMIVKDNGTIDDLSPEEAQRISYLKGNRLYPKELVETYTQSYAYSGGLLNKWFLHKNQTEVVSLPSDENIIHVATTEGYKQMVVAEPYGRSYGIYKIFFFDATSGKRELVEFDQNSQITGPVAAADYIKREFPTFDWNSFALSEPRPIKIQSDFYWLMSIVPKDNAGIAQTVFLNTKTNKVLKATTQEEIDKILQGQEITTPIQSAPANSKEEINQKIESIQKQLDELKQLVN